MSSAKGFWDSYVNSLTKRTVDFKGRSDRREYIIFIIITWIVWFVLGLLSGLLRNVAVLSWILWVVSAVIWIFTFIAFIAIVVRRLHDIGKSGWWALLLLIPVVNIIFVIYLAIAK